MFLVRAADFVSMPNVRAVSFAKVVIAGAITLYELKDLSVSGFSL